MINISREVILEPGFNFEGIAKVESFEVDSMNCLADFKKEVSGIVLRLREIKRVGVSKSESTKEKKMWGGGGTHHS